MFSLGLYSRREETYPLRWESNLRYRGYNELPRVFYDKRRYNNSNKDLGRCIEYSGNRQGPRSMPMDDRGNYERDNHRGRENHPREMGAPNASFICDSYSGYRDEYDLASHKRRHLEHRRDVENLRLTTFAQGVIAARNNFVHPVLTHSTQSALPCETQTDMNIGAVLGSVTIATAFTIAVPTFFLPINPTNAIMPPAGSFSIMATPKITGVTSNVNDSHKQLHSRLDGGPLRPSRR